MGNRVKLRYIAVKMKIKKILNEHQRHQPEGALADNLGDGYLMTHNSVFRNIRVASIKAGIQFTSSRFHEYDVLPLVQLPKILEEKKVPYLPNVKPLSEIESAMPDQFQIYEAPPLRANYVMHESAHVVARLLRIKCLGELKLERSNNRSSAINSERQLALAIMMEESFANTAESLLSVAANTAIHDEFVMKNAYVHETPEMRGRLRTAVSKIGFTATFRLVFFSFLHSNFLKRKINPKEFDRVLRVSFGGDVLKVKSLDQKLFRDLREIFHGGFDLDPMFTGLTSSFCMRLLGIKTPLQNLFEFDFMARFETNKPHLDLMNAFADLIEKGKWE